MTSIRDVARDVAMSTATVSRALRGLPGVSWDNRNRVLEAAERLGYVPSPSAAGLASGRTWTVAVIVPQVTQWFFGQVILGAEEVLRAAGYDLLLYNLAGDRAARHRVFQTSLLSKRADAVLVLGLRPSAEERHRLAELDRPVTVVGADAPGFFSVRIDDELAGRMATEHLADLGHRRIGYVGCDVETAVDFTAPPVRLAGFRAVVAARGLDDDPDLGDLGDFTVAGGAAAARRLLSLRERPTALFAASDEMAIGALRTARDLGLAVPEDLSVIGIDDHELADFFDLSTVRQPVLEQGRVAAQAVLEQLLPRPSVGAPRELVLPLELVARGSTAPPRREMPGT